MNIGNKGATAGGRSGSWCRAIPTRAITVASSRSGFETASAVVAAGFIAQCYGAGPALKVDNPTTNSENPPSFRAADHTPRSKPPVGDAGAFMPSAQRLVRVRSRSLGATNIWNHTGMIGVS